MKRIGNSKEPTIQRMLNMTFNLHSKFNCYCAVDLNVRTYHHSSESTHSFWIYMDTIGGQQFNTWPGQIKQYRWIMKQG